VPPGRNFRVSDITIAGRRIEYGAQIADRINMKLVGVGCRFGQSTVAPFTACRRLRGASGFVAAPRPTVASALAAPRSMRR
jgi:hypothetical protein